MHDTIFCVHKMHMWTLLGRWLRKSLLPRIHQALQVLAGICMSLSWFDLASTLEYACRAAVSEYLGSCQCFCIFCCSVFSQFGHVDQAPSVSSLSVNQDCDCQLVPIKQKNKPYVCVARCRYSTIKSTRPTPKQYKPRFKTHMFMLCDPIGHAM